MYKNRFSKILLALAASGMMTCAIATPGSETPQNNAATPDAAIDYSADTKQLLEQWVTDLKKAFPNADYNLIEFQNQGNHSTATIRAEVTNAGGMSPYSDPIVIASDTKIKIEHGLTFSELGVGIAKIEFVTALSDKTSEDIIDFFGTRPFVQAQGIITLEGDIHATTKNPAPFKKEFDGGYISIPSYEGRFDTVNARAQGNVALSIPTVEILSTSPYSQGSGFTIENFQFKMKDRPIKTGYWEFAGSSSGSIDKMEFKKDNKSLFSLQQIAFSEKGSIDDKKLYSDTFSLNGQGAFEHRILNKTVKIDSFKMEGSIYRLPIEPYLELIKTLQDGSFEDTDKLEDLGVKLITAGPEMNLDKLSLTLDGKEGNASLKMSIGAVSADEQQMPIMMILAQKVKIDANIDLPQAWLSTIFGENAEDIESALKQGEQEGYLTFKGGRIQSSFKYEMGNMSVNGKPLKGLRGLPF